MSKGVNRGWSASPRPLQPQETETRQEGQAPEQHCGVCFFHKQIQTLGVLSNKPATKGVN